MSDSYERSYYEIALTNGQVLVALGILLGCVLGAFLSGVWVAKKALDGEQRSLAAEPVASLESPGGETFEFFAGSRQGPEGSSQRTAETPAAARPSSIPQAPVQQLRPLPGATARAQTDPAERRGSGSRPAPSRRDPVDDAPPRVEPPVATVVASDSDDSSAAAPVSLSEVPVIQVFSSNDQVQAARLVERLRGAGYRAFLSPVEVDGRTMYRVRVGPFTNRQEAETEAEKVKREFKLDTWITTG